MRTAQWMTVMAAIAMATAAFAEPGGGGKHGDGGPPDDRGMRRGGDDDRPMPIERLLRNDELVQKLGITDAQIQALEEQAHTQRAKMIELRSAAELADLEVERLTDAAKPDRAAIAEAIQKAGQARTAIRAAQMDGMFATREILGEETFKKLKGEARQRMREHRQKRDGDGDGPRGRGGDDDDDDRPRGGGGDRKGPPRE